MYHWVKTQDKGTKSEKQTMCALPGTSRSSGCSTYLRECIARSTLYFRDPVFLGRLSNTGQHLEQEVVCGMSDNTLQEQNHCFIFCNKLKNTWPLWPSDHLHTYNNPSAPKTSDHSSLSNRALFTKEATSRQGLMQQRYGSELGSLRSTGFRIFKMFSVFDVQKQYLRIETRK